MNYRSNSRRFLILIMLFLAYLSLGLVNAQAGEARAIFAGGCFWCTESDFEKVSGVKDAVSGYIGGKQKNPSYKEVAGGVTGHTEAVLVKYDPKLVSYSDLLEYFWRMINPTDLEGQFVDRGAQYRPEIFFLNDEQFKKATDSKNKLIESKRFSKPIIVPITKAGKFYEAEEYHQDYYKKNPIRYRFYRHSSGRDQYLKKVWGSDLKYNHKKSDSLSKKELRKKLTPLQYHVTQEDGTEPPFQNKYFDHKEDGIYVDIVSGEPLFSSTHKFKSGTGWPSFYKPLEDKNIIEKVDKSHSMERVEVRSKNANSHLGHVFKDGPKPTGLRYCINSAALKFIPVKSLKENGLGQYLSLFESKTQKVSK